jgi:protein phosphatase 1 regulatory subunit 7
MKVCSPFAFASSTQTSRRR